MFFGFTTFFLLDVTLRLKQNQAQLDAATKLNTEYQEKLRNDDVMYLKRSNEFNQLERKCESQSKEITRLVERVQLLSSQNEEAQYELARRLHDKVIS